MPRTSAAIIGKNRAAFLDTIAWSEIGPELLAKSDDGYNVEVSSTPAKPVLFASYARHPHALFSMLKAPPSTAAGRYQILAHLADVYEFRLHLPDFGPESQDRIALAFIGECRAFQLIDDGRLAEAVVACSSRWASFPGNTYRQHQQRIADLELAFTNAGGTLAPKGATP